MYNMLIFLRIHWYKWYWEWWSPVGAMIVGGLVAAGCCSFRKPSQMSEEDFASAAQALTERGQQATAFLGWEFCSTIIYIYIYVYSIDTYIYADRQTYHTYEYIVIMYVSCKFGSKLF